MPKYEIHPAADIFPVLESAELGHLAADIKENGLREPIVIWGRGGPVIDGRNRIHACGMIGVEPEQRVVDPEVIGDPVAYVLSLNLHRRHLNESQRAMVGAKVATLRDGQHPGAQICALAQADAAEALSVGRRSIQHARKVQEQGPPELSEAVERGRVAVSVASEAVDLLDGPGEMIQALETNTVREVVKEKRAHVANNTGDFEWYTPEHIVEAAREAMGGIDLDPASCEAANEIIKARRFHTIEDDGLTKPWRGRVFVNPPYAKRIIDKFAAKLKSEIVAGNVYQAVVVVNNATETEWFNDLWEVCTAVCFPRKRVKFWSPNPKGSSPLQGQAILYYGNAVRSSGFARVFSKIGASSMWGTSMTKDCIDCMIEHRYDHPFAGTHHDEEAEDDYDEWCDSDDFDYDGWFDGETAE